MQVGGVEQSASPLSFQERRTDMEKANGKIAVLCRTTNRRDGTWHTGYARPDLDWRDVVRGATFTEVDRVTSAKVVTDKRGRPQHWLFIIK
jgi:hypothetical protein